MKKVFGLICGLIFLLSITGCSHEKSPKMYIAPAELTKEELNITKLLGEDGNHAIFDFVADDTLQSIQINTYELKDGRWVLLPCGGGYALSEAKGRVAFSFDNIRHGLRVAVQENESSSFSSSHQSSENPEEDEMSRTTSILSEQQEFLYEQEIPLVVQIITSKEEIHSYVVDYFHHPEEYEKYGYEHVYAITICFRQSPLS